MLMVLVVGAPRGSALRVAAAAYTTRYPFSHPSLVMANDTSLSTAFAATAPLGTPPPPHPKTTLAQMHDRTRPSASDAEHYTLYGDVNAVPMYEFVDCTFYKLSSDDRGYFNMLLGDPLWNLVQSIQCWIFANPYDRITLGHTARMDRIRAWALTGLAQNTRVARCCCFMQMTILYKDSPKPVARLSTESLIA